MVLASAILGVLTEINTVIRVVMVVLCYTGAANALNDVIDYNIDLINRPMRPLPSGFVKKRTALYISILLFSMGPLACMDLSETAKVIGIVIAMPFMILYSKYLKGVDMYEDENGKIVQVEEDRRIYKKLWVRTLKIAFYVTLFCFLMAYPIAHLLATLPMKYSNLLMICVLLPFWTSLLVRTASWMILLQQQGIVNDFFVWIGLVADDNRPEMMYNKVGTYVEMTQILLPFMVLPLYSVMKTISPSLMRAGKSLGGTPFVAFWKVYFPLTIPGIGAGCLLVFILAIGYYITPALVGGASGTLISNHIAFHMKSTLDWSFASAMGLMLLSGVLAIYWVYNKLVGVDNIKLG